MQLKKKPTEENRKQDRFFNRVPYDFIIYQIIIDSDHIKNNTRATPGTSHCHCACRMECIILSRSSPRKTPYTVRPNTSNKNKILKTAFFLSLMSCSSCQMKNTALYPFTKSLIYPIPLCFPGNRKTDLRQDNTTCHIPDNMLFCHQSG